MELRSEWSFWSSSRTRSHSLQPFGLEPRNSLHFHTLEKTLRRQDQRVVGCGGCVAREASIDSDG